MCHNAGLRGSGGQDAHFAKVRRAFGGFMPPKPDFTASSQKRHTTVTKHRYKVTVPKHPPNHTMPNKTSRIFIAALTAAVFTAGSAFAQQDPNKALIDLLVKKGVLTQQDVADLRADWRPRPRRLPLPLLRRSPRQPPPPQRPPTPWSSRRRPVPFQATVARLPRVSRCRARPLRR
jgi:hypothetical protein